MMDAWTGVADGDAGATRIPASSDPPASSWAAVGQWSRHAQAAIDLVCLLASLVLRA